MISPPSLSFTQLQDLFYNITETILPGMDVRHAYQPDSQPESEIGQNVIFLNIIQTDSNEDFDKYRDINYTPYDQNNVSQDIFYTRVLQITWTIYGPNSFDYADTIRFGVMTEAVRGMLSPNNIFPLTYIPAPTRAPDQRNGQWWERSDLNVYFNFSIQRTEIVPYLTAASVTLIDDNGAEEIVIVAQPPSLGYIHHLDLSNELNSQYIHII